MLEMTGQTEGAGGAPAGPPQGKGRRARTPVSPAEMLVKKRMRWMIYGLVGAVLMFVFLIVIFFMTVKVPTENVVLEVVATPEGEAIDIDSGKYTVWAPEGFGGRPVVEIWDESGRVVFETESGGMSTNVQGWTKLGTWDSDGGLFDVVGGPVTVRFTKSIGGLCTTCWVVLVLMVIFGLLFVVSLFGWLRAKRELRGPPMPPPGAYPPQQMMPPPGQPPMQPPAQPPMQPPQPPEEPVPEPPEEEQPQ